MLSSLKRFAITFLITFCIASLLFGIVAVILVPNVLGMFSFLDTGSNQDDSQLVSGLIEDTGEAVVTQSGFSCLLVGTDYQPNLTPGANVTTDTIIFMSVSEAKKSFVYMSIPANMKVTVGSSTMTLGEVYSSKGIEYLCEKVTGLTGLAVGYYAVVSPGSMADIVDKLGGVEYSVPVNMNYEDPTQELKIEITKGYQNLDGKTAVEMLRYRTDSFTDRMARNVGFLQTLIRAYTTDAYKDQATELYVKLAPYVTTNFTQNEFVSYIDLIWSYPDFSEINLDYPGEYSTDDGVTVFTPDTPRAFSLLAEYKNS